MHRMLAEPVVERIAGTAGAVLKKAPLPQPMPAAVLGQGVLGRCRRTFRHEQDIIEQVIDLRRRLQKSHEHRAAAQVGEVAHALDHLEGGAAVQACMHSRRTQPM